MKIKIIEHIRYDGKSYGPGDVVDFPDDVAGKIIQGALAVTHEDASTDQGDAGDSPDDVPGAPKKAKKKGN